MKRLSSQQSGFSIITAIFVIVILASVGAFMATIGGSQQLVTHFSVLGSRTLLVAQSGMEWAVHDVLRNTAAGFGGCNPSGSTSFTPSAPGLSGFSVTLGCSSTPGINEGGLVYAVYALTSTASTGTLGTPAYASRTISATVTTAP